MARNLRRFGLVVTCVVILSLAVERSPVLKAQIEIKLKCEPKLCFIKRLWLFDLKLSFLTWKKSDQEVDQNELSFLFLWFNE